jgi:hypothetical protein
MKDDNEFRDLLREAFQPPANAEPGRDLWPRMLRRLDRGETRRPWLDWVLAAVAVAWMVLFPEVIPSLMYHL